MAALMERIVGAFSWSTKAESPHRTIVREEQPSRHMVGKYHADYTALTDDQLDETDQDMEALLRRSRVVSEKRGL